MKEELNLRIKFGSKEEAEHAAEFTKTYLVESVLTGNEKTILKSNDKKSKKCRFCKLYEPIVTFKQKTHVIPQMFNKAKPESDFECDTCNGEFSKYESDFGHFFLLDRAMFGHRKKKSGYPKIKSKNGASVQRSTDIEKFSKDFQVSPEVIKKFETDELRLINIFQDLKGTDVVIDDENKKLNLKILKPPYRPLNVFRVFLKIGLSMITNNEVEKFESLFNLLSNEYPEMSRPELRLYRYSIPIHYNFFKHPIVYLCRKRIDNPKYCDKLLITFFGNKIFQIPLFSDDNYRTAYDKKEKMIIGKISPYLNPLITHEEIIDEQFLDSLRGLIDYQWNLSSKELVKNDLETIELQMN